MIPYIQPIFIPDETRYCLNERSILSLFSYLNKYPYDVKIVLGGWALTDELWTKINELITTKFIDRKIILKRYDKNYGKAHIVNDLVKLTIKENDNFKYFLTADSDMVFDLNTEHIFERLSAVPENSQRILGKKFGAAYLNQYEQNCHLPYIYENQYTFVNRYGKKELLVYGKYPGGMGGGSVFIDKEAWLKIGGYRVMGVYAGDDAYLMIDLNNNNYSYQMIDTVGLIHPLQSDTEYNVWKHKVVHRDSGAGKNEEQLKIIIEESEEFWKNKKS